jgi:flagellar assembly protein FliH
MSLSKEKAGNRNLSIIKANSARSKMKIDDYKSVLEEIEADERRDFDIGNLLAGESDGNDYSDLAKGEGAINSVRSEIAGAYEEGFEAGKTEATKLLQIEYEKKVENAIGDFASMVHQLSDETGKYKKEFDKAIVTLALAVARRIVAREIVLDEGAVLARAHEAIRKIIGVERVKIHINPADEEYIREHRNELSNYADSVKEIVIEADHKVERGGCIIESELGNIDAKISTQFDLIEEAFLELAK